MFSSDTVSSTRRNLSAPAPPSTPGHDAGQSIHGRHGPTTAPIATRHARAHLIQHRACEQTCPALTARSATPGRGCHRPPRPYAGERKSQCDNCSEESARRAILVWECRDRPPRRSVGKRACVFSCGYDPTPGPRFVFIFLFLPRKGVEKSSTVDKNT